MFREALRVTNNNIIITIPLVLFVYVLDLYTNFSKPGIDNFPKLILASVTVTFMIVVFCSGWFYMIKKAVELSKKVFVLDLDRARETLKLYKKMPEGIGELFIPFMFWYIILFVFQIFLFPAIYYIGSKLIGNFDDSFLASIQSVQLSTLNEGHYFVDSLSFEQLIFLFKWSLLLMISFSIIAFFLMLWIPEIVYKTRNPLKALWYSWIKLFKNFFLSAKIYVGLWLLGFILLFLNTFSLVNPAFYILINVMIYYYIVYAVILVFMYYDKKYNNEEE